MKNQDNKGHRLTQENFYVFT